MVQRIQVYWICAVRAADCSYISHLAGRNRDGSRWELTAAEALLAIEHRKMSFYILRNGQVHDIVSDSIDGRAFLKCNSDEVLPLQLLALPSFEPGYVFSP